VGTDLPLKQVLLEQQEKRGRMSLTTIWFVSPFMTCIIIRLTVCLQFNADRGEIDFAYRLGKIFYQGSIYGSPGGIASGSEGVGAIPRNYGRARYYFLLIARQVWPQDPPHSVQVKDERKPVNYAAVSAGYLGRMYLRGEGVKQDFAIAKLWFERGAEHGDRECHNGLGIILRDGLGVRSNMKAALSHFTIASGQDLAEAQVNLGKYHYGQLSSPRLFPLLICLFW
jgi:SEL1 protein